MKLRPYQTDAVAQVENAWARGVKNIMLRMPTGAGKTASFGHLIHKQPGASCVIAHRAELVSQSALALATYGIRHRIIGPPELQRTCSAIQLAELGVNYVSQNSRCAVAGVDTLTRMGPRDPWFGQVREWVVDEGHHLQSKNKWGRAVAMFTHPEVRGLAVTATPARPDGRGLGRANDGLIDEMVHGPEMRWLINSGYLTDYRIFGIPSDVNYSDVDVTASGDLSPVKLSAAVHKSKEIVGDIVEHYIRIASGKLGITFCVDIKACIEVAAEYRRRGVPAEVITGETHPSVRAAIMRKFRNREILQLVNVDILGEGVDVPAVEVVSMARKTASFIVFAQQFGRVLRLFLPIALRGAWDTYTDAQRRQFIAESEKPYGMLIDHVGNVDPARGGHGLPDKPREWSLERREKRSRSSPLDVDPVRTCLNPNAKGSGIACMAVYRKVLDACPECGHVPEPARRSEPEYVDGVLNEYSPELLARLRGDVDDVFAPLPERIDSPTIPHGLPMPAQMAFQKRYYEKAQADRAEHLERQDAQTELRAVMATWGGWRAIEGDTVSMTQRRFFFAFGVDVMSAQALPSTAADDLARRVAGQLDAANIER